MAPKVAPDPTTEVVKYEHAPNLEGPQDLPSRAVCLGPSGSGKSVLLQWLLTSPQAYPAVRRIYVWSPSVDIDPLWEVVKKYSREVLGVNQDEEKTFFSEFNPADLQEVISTQEAVVAYIKKQNQSRSKKQALPSVLLVFDDLADTPSFMKREKLLHQLYIRGRHNALSVITATQVWKALAPECRKQATALYIFKLRNYADLEGLAEELGAVHPDGKKGVLALYRQCTAEAYGFLYCDLLAKDPSKMFYNKDFEPLGL